LDGLTDGAFVIANDDLVAREIDIFYAQAQAFHEAEGRGVVEKFGEQVVRAGHGGDHPADFIPGHHKRQPGDPLGANEIIHPIGFDVEDLVVEENKRSESLVLSGGGDFFGSPPGHKETPGPPLRISRG